MKSQSQKSQKSKSQTSPTSTGFKKKRIKTGGKKKTGHKLPGTDKRFFREHPNDEPRIEEHPEPVEDIEKTLPEPKDAASKHKFPPPKKHPLFRRVWMAYIDNVTGRENFKNGHLLSLEILCDLHVEYEDLRAFVRTNGRSYKSYGRSGMVWKFYPEVAQLTRVQAQIKEYMKVLGLILKKDHGVANPDGEKGEWD